MRAWTLYAVFEPYDSTALPNEKELERHLSILRQSLAQRYEWTRVTGMPHRIMVEFDVRAEDKDLAEMLANSVVRQEVDTAGFQQFQLTDSWALPSDHPRRDPPP
jgi:hypothetical protein